MLIAFMLSQTSYTGKLWKWKKKILYQSTKSTKQSPNKILLHYVLRKVTLRIKKKNIHIIDLVFV